MTKGFSKYHGSAKFGLTVRVNNQYGVISGTRQKGDSLVIIGEYSSLTRAYFCEPLEVIPEGGLFIHRLLNFDQGPLIGAFGFCSQEGMGSVFIECGRLMLLLKPPRADSVLSFDHRRIIKQISGFLCSQRRYLCSLPGMCTVVQLVAFLHTPSEKVLPLTGQILSTRQLDVSSEESVSDCYGNDTAGITMVAVIYSGRLAKPFWKLPGIHNFTQWLF